MSLGRNSTPTGDVFVTNILLRPHKVHILAAFSVGPMCNGNGFQRKSVRFIRGHRAEPAAGVCAETPPELGASRPAGRQTENERLQPSVPNSKLRRTFCVSPVLE